MKTCGKGHGYETRTCNACRREAYAITPEKILVRNAAWRAANPEKHLACSNAYYKNNKTKVRADQKEYYENNKEAVIASTRTYNKNNKDKVSSLKKKYREENLEKTKADIAAWRAANPDVVSALNAKRRSAKLQQTPPWYTHTDCVAIYKELKPGYNVDHIIPLQGENVSGLHWHHNLQLLPAVENMSKGNKFDPDTYVHELPLY